MAVVHHRAVAVPRGYALAWSALGAGAAALIGFQLLHHPGGVGGSRPGAPFAAPSAGSPPVHVSLPAGAPSSLESVAVPGAGRPSSTVAARVASSATPTPAAPTPGRPSPAGPGLVQVGAALVVPLRGSTPVAVRVAVVVPTAPPPWPPVLGLGVGYVR